MVPKGQRGGARPDGLAFDRRVRYLSMRQDLGQISRRANQGEEPAGNEEKNAKSD